MVMVTVVAVAVVVAAKTAVVVVYSQITIIIRYVYLRGAPILFHVYICLRYFQ